MATLEERLAAVEVSSRTHDAMFNLMLDILERQQTLLEQVQRDSQKTHRIWVWFCKKYGWPEDDEDQDEG